MVTELNDQSLLFICLKLTKKKIWFPVSTVVVYIYVMLNDEDLVSC